MLFLSILLLAFLVCVTAIQSAVEWRKDKIWDRLGSLSPYHSAPTVNGVQADLPNDCTVDQIMLVSIGSDDGFDLEHLVGRAKLTLFALRPDGPPWFSVPTKHGAAFHPKFDIQVRKSL